MLRLLTIALTIPVSSVDCKNKDSRLKTENVCILMRMSVNTPEMENFGFHKAFVIWCSTKDRVICR